MASRKITQLTELTAPASADVLPIVDVSEASPENQNKKITYAELLSSAPAGTAAAPAFAFDGDPDTGIYASAANELSVTTGGTERLRIDATGQIEAVSLGTAAAPTYTFTGDPNSGLYSPGADQVAISTGGTGRLFIDASGNVGIGATSPTDGLHLYATSDTKYALNIDGPYTGSSTNKYIAFSGNGTKALIGELYRETAVNRIRLDAKYDGFVVGTGASGTALERLRITASGLVGIGTVNPAYGLEVNNQNIAITNRPSTGTSNPVLYLRRNVESGDAGVVATHGSLVFQTDYAANGVFATSSSILAGSTTGDSVNTYFAFSTTNSGGTLGERLRIDGSGRLLVGAATSADVGGASAIAQFTSTGTAPHTLSLVRVNEPILAMGRTGALINGSGLGVILFCGDDGTDLNSIGASITAQVDGTHGVNAMPGRLVFSTTANGAANPTERMRITSDAYVRLASGTGGIQFNGDTAAANALDDYEEGTFTPVFRDGTAGTAATQTEALGRYTKIGNIVRYYLHLLNVTTTGLTAGNIAHITGLPFKAALINNAEYDALATVNSATPTTGCVSLNVQSNQSYGLLVNQTTTGQAAFTVSQATNGSFDLFVQGTYHVA